MGCSALAEGTPGMSERLTYERLAELRARQQERIEGRGGVPEVKDLLKALDELIGRRAMDAQHIRITYDPPRCAACGAPYGHGGPTGGRLLR